MRRRAWIVAAAFAAGLGGCGGDDSEPPSQSPDRGAGVGALGGSAGTEVLARAELRSRDDIGCAAGNARCLRDDIGCAAGDARCLPKTGGLSWIATEAVLEPNDSLRHSHESF